MTDALKRLERPAKVVFVADAHLSRETEAVAAFLDYLRKALVDATGLYLLGDIFHYAIGTRSFRGPELETMLSFLDEVGARGVRCGYVAGNRDFFLDRVFRLHPKVVFTEGILDIEPFGRAVRLAHGDTINRADRQYLLWRRLSRSWPMRMACSALPRSAARRLADWLERAMKSSNAAYRVHFPEEECRRFGEEAASAGRPLVLLGHFHEARTLPIDGPHGPGALHVVPDWLSQRTHAELWSDGRFVLDAREGGVRAAP